MDCTVSCIAPTPENIKECIDLCVKSFDTDDLYNWVYQTPQQKSKLLPLTFYNYFHQSVLWGGCILGIKHAGKIIAMALIQPPFTEWNAEIERANFELHEKSAVGINSRAAHERLLALDAFFDGCPAAEYNEFYLLFLAVDPEYSNKGLGSKIIQHLSMLADLLRIPVALDTSHESLVKFYKKFGFEIKKSRSFEGRPALCSYIMKRIGGCPPNGDLGEGRPLQTNNRVLIQVYDYG